MECFTVGTRPYMNRHIPDEIIEQIRDRADIVDVVGSYLPLKRAGTNFKALCPFHDEKTPSFMVNPQRNSFHCFGCGKGGDSFRFVMERENVDFPNAIHLLANRYNITIPEEPIGQGTRSGQSSDRERLYSLHETLRDWYTRLLWENPSPIQDYFLSRAIPREIADAFQLGASPDSWTDTIDFLRGKGFTEKELRLSGIAKESDKDNSRIYDRFRNRLMFPIWNEQGRVVAFSARTIEADHGGAKYINSPETPIFQKSRVLYGLPLARKAMRDKGAAILCEGQLDVIAMHRAGFDNTVAPQGTAFTDEQARILKRYSETLILAFDSDGAGIKAAVRAIDIALPTGLEVKVALFPPGSDPDDLFKQGGPDAIANIISSAGDFFDFLLQMAQQGSDGDSSWNVDKIVNDILEHVARIDSTVIRSSYAMRLAQRLRLPENAIFAELNKRRRTDATPTRRAPSVQAATPTASLQTIQNTTSGDKLIEKAEETLLELALAHGTVGKRLEEALPHEMISQSPIGRALNKVILKTMEGDWEMAADELLADLADNPEPAVSRILTNPTQYDHEHQEKAVDDCLRTIKTTLLSKEIDQLNLMIAQCADETQRQDLLRQRSEKIKQRSALRKNVRKTN